MKIIPYGKQCVDNLDIAEVVKVLKSDWITQGSKVHEFEKAIARYCNAKYAVVVSSGTAALHLSCLAIGLNKGDEAITSPITFLATPNSVLYTGARPVFADIDYDTVNINPTEIRNKITSKTKVILPVHFAGLPCDMPEIYKIAKNKGLKVIEDACHALGAEYKYNGKWIKIGSCKHSDMTVFSFHPVKAITTGEGGVITTNNKLLYSKLLALRSHGVYKTTDISTRKGSWYYEMRELGFNYRLTDFACALGISQLKKLDRFLERRREIALIYDRNIVQQGKQLCGYNTRSARHLYILKMDFKYNKIKRIELFNKLKKMGINAQVHYIPIYRQYYYKKIYAINPLEYPNTEKYYNNAISIPLFPDMKNRDAVYVADALAHILSGKTKREKYE